MDHPQPPMNDAFYAEGVARMNEEGIDMAKRIIAFMQRNVPKLTAMDRVERKKYILQENPEFETFAQVHPIVYEYISTEQIFNANAFKRYVRAVFGRPKSAEEQRLVAQDKKNMYYIKNKQYALYYKYLLQEMNPHGNQNEINNAYQETVAAMDASTKEMLERYEEAQKKAQIVEENLSQEKRAELVDLLMQRLQEQSNH